MKNGTTVEIIDGRPFTPAAHRRRALTPSRRNDIQGAARRTGQASRAIGLSSALAAAQLTRQSADVRSYGDDTEAWEAAADAAADAAAAVDAARAYGHVVHSRRVGHSSVSSAPEASVSPSLVPAFLAEQQRGC